MGEASNHQTLCVRLLGLKADAAADVCALDIRLDEKVITILANELELSSLRLSDIPDITIGRVLCVFGLPALS